MTSNDSPARVRHEIPPLRKRVELPLSPTAAFELFTVHLNEWWPVKDHSVGREEVRECGMQLMSGGRIYEIRRDGSEADWGRITEWVPPLRLSFSWHPGRPLESAQLVSVVFAAADGGARVDLVHERWERLGAEAEAMRERYDSGWDWVFGRCFAEFAAERARSSGP